MKRITLFFIIIFIGFQINLIAQEQETILDILNKSNANSTYLKDLKFELGPGENAKYSVILSKTTKYEFSIYRNNLQLDFELFEDKTEENLLQKKEKLSEQVIKADFTPKQSGVYHIVIKNNSDKIIKSVLLLSFLEQNGPTTNEEIVVIEKNNNCIKNTETDQINDEIFVIVEQMPRFGNTDDDKESGKLFREFIAKQIIYPEEAKAKNIQGRVYVTFVVDKEGYIRNAKIARGVHPALDQEALRVVYSSPRWKAGTQRGQNVNVSYTMPITFELKNDKKGE